MDITPGDFVRTFPVKAIQVNASNMAAVAHWCGGKVVGSGTAKYAYIQVDVERAQTERMTRAYVGDWVLKTPKGYKVYRKKVFGEWFKPTDTKRYEKILDLVCEAMATQHEYTKVENPLGAVPHAETIAKKIFKLI